MIRVLQNIYFFEVSYSVNLFCFSQINCRSLHPHMLGCSLNNNMLDRFSGPISDALY